MEETKTSLEAELANVFDLGMRIAPRKEDMPRMQNIDIYGASVQVNGHSGGDHVMFVDFKRDPNIGLEHMIEIARKESSRDFVMKLESNRGKSAVIVADVSGHSATDVAISYALHQAFMVAAPYELEKHGEITTELFERLDTPFVRVFSKDNLTGSGIFSKIRYITLIYGEISEAGVFRYISAGNQHPISFSSEYMKLMPIDMPLHSSPPIGLIPLKSHRHVHKMASALGYKEGFLVNELRILMPGDILIFATDGLFEHQGKDNTPYYPVQLERVLKENYKKSSKEIYKAIIADILNYGTQLDDISLVVAKRLH